MDPSNEFTLNFAERNQRLVVDDFAQDSHLLDRLLNAAHQQLGTTAHDQTQTVFAHLVQRFLHSVPVVIQKTTMKQQFNRAARL